MATRSTAAVPSKYNEPKQIQQNGLKNHKFSIFPTTSKTSVQENRTSLQSSIKQTFYATTYNKSFPSNHRSRFSSSAKMSSSYSGRPKPSTSSQPPPIQRRAYSASISSVNGTSSSYIARGVTGKGSVVDRHADMRLYLQHRQRVLESKPRITSACSFSSQRSNTRSNSVPISLSRNSPQPTRKGGYAVS
ncbi:hypothetical protein DdX_06437 [Ditylenchus destructor]|uniref:Uncharacterized protein n=1 Tax=Ditylenchus destructor TaxID=166010 RepID=A0AAD4R8Y2_9BILA|nr:hypothetical protein DdX_06437 [Ditylenchus destructor]